MLSPEVLDISAEPPLKVTPEEALNENAVTPVVYGSEAMTAALLGTVTAPSNMELPSWPSRSLMDARAGSNMSELFSPMRNNEPPPVRKFEMAVASALEKLSSGNTATKRSTPLKIVVVTVPLKTLAESPDCES